MTEHEWLACGAPEAMLKYLQDCGRAGDRKLRLFTCACCRRIWDALPPPSRRAVEVVERFVDGLAGEEERRAAESSAGVLVRSLGEFVPPDVRITGAAARGVWAALMAIATRETFRSAHLRSRPEAPTRALRGAYDAAREVRAALQVGCKTEPLRVEKGVAREQSQLLRCIFGNPFRSASFDPALRTPAVLALAGTAYEERRFEELPLLADALEEAGCADDDLLAHLRSGGAHARGCWALDLILGKS
jgi:hypothetical protein